MKYNPKVNEKIAAHPRFAGSHPQLMNELSQGSLRILYAVQEDLKRISGFHSVTLQPAAGAQGEFTGVLLIRAYHRARGDEHRTRILIPDSAHGTNPATVTMAGLTPVQLPTDARGNVDLEALRAECDERTAGLMITNPNTLGLFEEEIEEVIGLVHEAGGLVYGDGANMNAILGVLRPADIGIDVMHFNLHKTFSTPHGGGGPGSGPVGCSEPLAPFLPSPLFREHAGSVLTLTPPKSIGRLKSFYGNFGMILRAWAYIRSYGDSIHEVGENAVLNANYLRHFVRKLLPLKYDRGCMHEFVASGVFSNGISTMDVAKRLIDYGVHPPTVYFPLIVREALMIEPTETETRETLEHFAEILAKVIHEAETDPQLLHDAPLSTPVARLDEVRAVKQLVLSHRGRSAELTAEENR
jgi:glycine dehydrogenase subunit 2